MRTEERRVGRDRGEIEREKRKEEVLMCMGIGMVHGTYILSELATTTSRHFMHS